MIFRCVIDFGIGQWSTVSMEFGYCAIENYQLIYGNTCNTQYIGDGENAVESALKNKICYSSLIDKIDCINHKVKVSIILSK